MKKTIKKTLVENVNALGVKVTRPNQVLIIMRGVSGAGKSTKAKSLVGNGIIHSTDDLIEKSGDYNEFFAKMIADQEAKKENAFAPLHKMHKQNLANAIVSMEAGYNPVVIDNTNIKHGDAKAYVMWALQLGFADENIQFVDVGTSGLTAEELAARNKHGVPLEKIKSMMASHKGQGKITLKKILAIKDKVKKSNVLYSAVVLDEKSRARLLSMCQDLIPTDWEKIAHHMTIIFGKELPEDLKSTLGQTVILTVDTFGSSDMAMAVTVRGFKCLTVGKPAHITVAINRAAGAKPVMGGEIKDWKLIIPFELTGVVTEVKK